MRWVKSMVMVASVAALGACSDGPKPSSTPRAAAKPAPAKVAEPAAEAAAAATDIPAVAYSYNPLGKRDPFRVPEEIVPRAGAADVNRDCSDPLCQWDLEQLTLTAVVTGDSNPFAMLVDPQGRGYIVRRNTKVGRQGGRVTQVLRDALVVTEYWNQPDGKRTAMPKNIRMKQESNNSVPAMDLFTGKTFD